MDKTTWLQTGIVAVVIVLCCATTVSGKPSAICSKDSCPAECDTCTPDKVCCSCAAGRYGNNCEQFCHINCDTCSDSGLCGTCTDTSMYGPLCMQSCDLCEDGACGRSRCKNGCKAHFYEEVQQLPGQPKVHKCLPCPDFCTDCKTSNNCTVCINRRWGRVCERPCPPMCERCDKETGECPPMQNDHEQNENSVDGKKADDAIDDKKARTDEREKLAAEARKRHNTDKGEDFVSGDGKELKPGSNKFKDFSLDKGKNQKHSKSDSSREFDLDDNKHFIPDSDKLSNPDDGYATESDPKLPVYNGIKPTSQPQESSSVELGKYAVDAVSNPQQSLSTGSTLDLSFCITVIVFLIYQVTNYVVLR